MVLSTPNKPHAAEAPPFQRCEGLVKLHATAGLDAKYHFSLLLVGIQGVLPNLVSQEVRLGLRVDLRTEPTCVLRKQYLKSKESPHPGHEKKLGMKKNRSLFLFFLPHWTKYDPRAASRKQQA